MWTHRPILVSNLDEGAHKKSQPKYNYILAENNKQALDILSAKIDYMKDEIICLKEQNTKQQQHIWRNESYSRRNNLLFRGYDQSNQSCDVIVRDIMSKMGVEAVDRIQMVRCHYLNNNKQIIARFHSFADRERVWKNRFNLKTSENKQLYVSEDFPAAITAERKQLYPILKAAKVIPEYHRKVTIINNKLKLKDRLYTVDTLNNLPTNVHPASLAERSSDDVYVFGGITSRFCKHSNFFVRKFVYEHISYNTVEQAYQHKKARLAKDLNKCREILFNADPGTQKFLGQRVRGLNEEEWNKNRLQYMREILIAKYTQHQDLCEALLSTGRKKLAEGNSRDDFYGIGLALTHNDVLNPTVWRGNNHLGKLLMEVREELRG